MQRRHLNGASQQLNHNWASHDIGTTHYSPFDVNHVLDDHDGR